MNLYIFSRIELLDIAFTPFMARCKFIRGTKLGLDSKFVSNEFLHLFIFYANFFRSCFPNLSDFQFILFWLKVLIEFGDEL